MTTSNWHFYPRSPCGERHHHQSHIQRPIDISIHALLAESDGVGGFSELLPPHISIHALLAESDCGGNNACKVIIISIHALLAESDLRAVQEVPQRHYFYPRSPCGERPQFPQLYFGRNTISIHALLAESDRTFKTGKTRSNISIHALLAESDFSLYSVEAGFTRISIHALLAESDR